MKNDFSLFASLHYLKIVYKQVTFLITLRVIVFFVCFKQTRLDWRIKESLIEIQPMGISLPLSLGKAFLGEGLSHVLGTSPYFASISSSFQWIFGIMNF